ncbi:MULTISPECIES: hypothetical protein [Methylotenera]|uniref:hypothetical protein n=1 Tax=Methylotenera TaxID=359407 RepID=UPI00036193F4|nr:MULTISPECIES: hypothetical protein [Methylotenera]
MPNKIAKCLLLNVLSARLNQCYIAGMLRVKANFVVYLIVLCFALLQVFTPFIHAHLNAEHPIQNTGFHVGDAHEEMAIELTHLHSTDTSSEHLDASFLSSIPHATHTISVASGITQGVDSTFLVVASLLVLFFLCFPFALTSVLRQFFLLSLTPLQPLKRRLPASRAPPQL